MWWYIQIGLTCSTDLLFSMVFKNLSNLVRLQISSLSPLALPVNGCHPAITPAGCSSRHLKVLTAQSMAELVGPRYSTAWARRTGMHILWAIPVGCSGCWQRHAHLRKKCYHYLLSTRFWCVVKKLAATDRCFFHVELAKSCCLPKQRQIPPISLLNHDLSIIHPSLSQIGLRNKSSWIQSCAKQQI